MTWLHKHIPKFQFKYMNKNIELPFIAVAGLMVSGIWPFKYKWINLTTISLLTSITILGEFIAAYEFWPDVTRECIVGSTIITGVRSMFVTILLCFRKDKFRRMTEKFVSRVCVTKLENREAHNVVKRNIMLSNIISMSMVSSLCLFLTLPLISSHQTKYEMFPFLIDFPFNIHSSFGFFFAYACCVLAGVGAVAFVVGHDTLMNYMLLHTCMRLKLLSSHIKGINDRLSDNETKITEEIQNVVIAHCEIISFVNEMEELFSPHILMHFLVTSLLICILGIEILFVDQNVFERTKVILYFITGLGQIYVCCDCGEKLIQNSYHVAEAVYSIRWPDISPKYRADILIIMQRAQKPLKLTAGKFFDLSMETFSSVLKTSVSYFALLKQFIEEN